MLGNLRRNRHLRSGAAGIGLLTALLGCLAFAHAGSEVAGDPVKALQEALPIQLESGSDIKGIENNARILKYRTKVLSERIAALRSVSDLRRALLLTEWKDDPGEDPRLYAIDQQMRAKVAKRFEELLTAQARGSDATSRLAAANLLGEIGTSLRAVRPTDPRDARLADETGFARSLAPLLVRLTRDPDGAVRRAAARALGRINADPATAVPALKAMLVRDGAQERRAAAQGLVDMVRLIGNVYGRGQQRGVVAQDRDVIAVGTAVVSAAGAGVRDREPQVRRLCLEAIKQSALVLGTLIPDLLTRDLPQGKEVLTLTERAKIEDARKLVQNLSKESRPLLKALQQQGAALAGALQDADASVRLECRQALEAIGNARMRFEKLKASIPEGPATPLSIPDTGVGVEDKAPAEVPLAPVAYTAQGPDRAAETDPLLEALAPAIDVIARGLHDPDARVRLAAAEFLETLGNAAQKAIPELVRALGDHDRYVRWAATRALWRIGPLEADVVVPALGRVIRCDPDADVRLMAIYAVRSYGTRAAAAVGDLIHATTAGDADVRIAAIQTLVKVVADNPKADAGPTVLALAAALRAEENTVRRAAAEALGTFGPRARQAVDALRRRALQDTDDEVRQLASEALLNILGRAPR